MNSLLSNLSMRRHKYGETHPKVGSAWNRIGNFFFRACQYEHALNAFKHAVACYPVGEADLACTYSNLGVTYWASGGEGAADQGMVFLQKAMDLYEIHAIAAGGDPENSISVATVLYQMGLCQTLRKPFELLKTANPADSLFASALPQCSLSSCRSLPMIFGMRTQMLALPRFGSHSSI